MTSTPRLALAACAVLLMLAGCSSGSSSAATTPDTTPAMPTPTATGTPVTATETEYRIALSLSHFTAGTYTFTVDNNGATTHALEIKGPGGEFSSARVSPGDSTTLTATLPKGTYDVFCPVGGHKDLGMDLSITVT